MISPALKKSAAKVAIALAVPALLLTACTSVRPPPKIAGDSGAVASGHYRNLFAENGHSPADIDKKISDAFAQLFHGDADSQAIYFSAGANSNGPLAYITDIKHGDVRTEGLSYGMMIAVQMNKPAEFNALWNWSKTFLYHAAPEHPSFGFFSWQAQTNGAAMSEFVAPDGESYYVTALYFAANRWGSGQGIYNYHAEADRLLTDMRHRAVITGKVSMLIRNNNVHETVSAGPLFDEDHKMVLFSPSTERVRFTDPSYQLPAFYELWARWGPAADKNFWLAAADTSRNFFSSVANPLNGLTPDYAQFDASPVTNGWNRAAANFRFDAFRTAANWSVDWSWWAKDPRERELSDKLQAFFEAQGMETYGCQFTLAGEPLDARHAQGLVAENAVASLAATNSRAKNFVEALWNTPTPDGLERYYEGLLYLMALLHCSGEFRAWPPH
jgi:oligosaccharide reducing-end xylanase